MASHGAALLFTLIDIAAFVVYHVLLGYQRLARVLRRRPAR